MTIYLARDTIDIMAKRYAIFPVLTLAFCLSACGQDGKTSSGNTESAPVGAEQPEQADMSSQSATITFADENEYIAKISADPTMAKKLGTSIGDVIEIKDYYVYSIDKSEWEKGGKLSLLNDYSLGNETRIECQLSAADGDNFVKDTSRRRVTLKGRIQSFSSALGLTISPCIATEK